MTPPAAKAIDVLYVAWNRLEFTRPSFAALVDNTNWDLVRRLYIHDDGSTDGTFEHLQRAVVDVPIAVELVGERLGGPVAAMNGYIGRLGERAPWFAKVDNDFVMCPGWLDALVAVALANPRLDVVGTEPGILLDVPPEGEPGDGYRYRPCEHIGGKGLIRTAAFDGRPMTPHGQNGYFGFTEWQVRNEDVREGWIDPDLRCFGLDQIPLEPWASLTDRYVELGWQRRWSKYAPAAADYWTWWTG